jgi:outer membrane protein assembly factor BamB
MKSFFKYWQIFFAIALSACAGSGPRPAAPLVSITKVSNIEQIWKGSLGGAVNFPLQLNANGRAVAIANSQGILSLLDTGNGQELWRIRLGVELTSGVGSDGTILSVTDTNNDVIAIHSNGATSKILWKQPLGARAFTAPLVAGGRIFVLSGNRTLQAFDAQTGAKLWIMQRQIEPLIVMQDGTLGVYKNTLLVGGSGRLLGINPDNGQVQWEVSVAVTRATNDIERLIDLVGKPNRVGDSVCVRAYQASVSCVDAAKETVLWTKSTAGSVGVTGDADRVISTESDGRVKSFNRTTGDEQWVNSQLGHRGLSAPLIIGSSVVVGDAQGFVHVLNKANGEFTARFSTDGSPITAAPIATNNTVLITTTRGGLFAFGPK